MLEQMFLKVLEMSGAASIVIAIVFIVRFLLKRFPKSISYLLWSVVLFRLLCPVTFELEIGLVPKLDSLLYEYTVDEADIQTGKLWERDDYNKSDMNATGIRQNDLESGKIEVGQNAPENNGIENRIETGQSTQGQLLSNGNAAWMENAQPGLFAQYGTFLWATGVVVMCLYSVVSVFKIRKKVRFSLPLKENIYLTDTTVSPFVMGIVKPRIYLPEGLNEKEKEYVILHEKYHIRRFDYLVKIIAFAALCIHWFNPLVWVAFISFCKDMEMSCDEAVIKQMGEQIKSDYASSLLSLATKSRVIQFVPVDFGEGDTKGRIKNLAVSKQQKKSVIVAVSVGVLVLIVCLAVTRVPEISEEDNISTEEKNFFVSLDITEQYAKSKGDPANFYRIDENNVLWGSGENRYGQLGQGTQDDHFYSEEVKIAENVVHVDFSQRGFMIFLTEDQKLYGVGNAGGGALRQYSEFDKMRYMNGEHYTVTTPVLLMEDVIYACCGRDDIVCMKADGTVWNWGTVYAGQGLTEVYFINEPEQVLENAILVTGGWHNHAALLSDGTVWTWGYNSAGNCGVAGDKPVYRPTMVAEDVIMVWTDLALDSYPQPGTNEIAMGWIGKLAYKMDYSNIAEFGDIYPYILKNTVIKKADGSYWVCGANVGTEEKLVHGAEGDYFEVWSDEFWLCEDVEYQVSGAKAIIATAERRLREDYTAATLTYVDNAETGWDYYADNPWESEEERDALAQAAIQELYTLTGYNVTECVYTTDGRSKFIFAKSKENIKKSIAFYARDYGSILWGDAVPYMGFMNARRVHYSDIQQLDSPYQKEELSGQGAIPYWFLEHSGVYQGEKITGFDVFNLDDTVYTHVKLLFDGGYYVVVMDEAIEAVSEVMGPYNYSETE